MQITGNSHKSVVIIGAGGFAREVLDVIDAINRIEMQYEVLGYVVDPQYGSPGTVINGKPILGGFDWLGRRVGDVSVICGVGASHQRYQLVTRAEAIGCNFCSIVHPNAVLTRWIELGTGVIITAGCILTNRIRLGNHVHVNLDCTIGHDVTAMDFVTMSPGVHVSGNVTLHDGVYVGTGANIIEKLDIGEWSVIGAGAAIAKDVPPNTTVVGVPGKVIKTRATGWQINEK